MTDIPAGLPFVSLEWDHPDILRMTIAAFAEEGWVIEESIARSIIKWHRDGCRDWPRILNAPSIRLAWIEPAWVRDARAWMTFVFRLPQIDGLAPGMDRMLHIYQAMSARGRRLLSRWLCAQPFECMTDKEASFRRFVQHCQDRRLDFI